MIVSERPDSVRLGISSVFQYILSPGLYNEVLVNWNDSVGEQGRLVLRLVGIDCAVAI
jgi:hypothetical protein